MDANNKYKNYLLELEVDNHLEFQDDNNLKEFQQDHQLEF